MSGRHAIAWALVAFAGCAADGGPAERDDRAVGGKADELSPNAACLDLVFDDTEGLGATGPADLAALRDPLAQHVLKAEDETCPSTVAEMVALLQRTDTAGCDGDTAGLRSMLVSETAQMLGRPTSFRSVTTRECGERPPEHLLWAQTGLSVDGPLPKDADLMAFDQASGTYNFYRLAGGTWSFHGSSLDMVAPEAGSDCARCHTTGGPVMKELDNPWLHWEGNADTPGTQPLIDAHAELGTRSDGAELEQIVRRGNAEWIETSMQHLLERGDLAELLRPLFCDVSVNLGTATGAVGDGVRFLRARALIDDTFDTGPFPLEVRIEPDAYEAAIAASGQVLREHGQPLLDDAGQPIVDTIFKMPFIQRGRIDQAFVKRLTEIGVIDEGLVLDALAIDFTRPIGSPSRCGLLRFAPDLGSLVAPRTAGMGADAVADKFADRLGNCCEEHEGSGCTGPGIEACVCAADDFCCTEDWDALCIRQVADFGCAACPGTEDDFASPKVDLVDGLAADVRAGFIDNLQEADDAGELADDPAAQQFLAHLLDPDDAAAHQSAAAELIAACNRRDPTELAADLLRIVSGRRNLARKLPVFEFQATLPRDDLDADPLAVLDPVDCTLPAAD